MSLERTIRLEHDKFGIIKEYFAFFWCDFALHGA